MKKGFNGIIEMAYTKNSNSLPPSYKKKKHKFNSKTFSNYLEIGKKYKDEGYRDFDRWFIKMKDTFGEPIESWGMVTWIILNQYSINEHSEFAKIAAMTQYVGALHEDGIITLSEVKSDFENKLSNINQHNKFNQFLPMLEASFYGIKAYYEFS